MKKIFFGLLILIAIMVIIAFLPQNKEKECFNLIRAKNYSKALRVGLKAIKNDPKNGKLYMCVGESYYYLNHYDEAIKYLKLAENYITSQNTLNILHNFEALTYDKLGNLYEKAGELNNALLYDNKALSLYNELGNKKGEFIELSKIARLYYNMNKLNKALEFYKKSLPLSSEQDKSMIYNMMGVIYYDKGNYKKAIKYDKKDIIVDKQLGNNDSLAPDYLNLGDAYIPIENFSKAQHYLTKGLSMEKDIGNPDWLGTGYEYFGNLYFAEGDNTNAKKYWKKALHYYKLADDKAGIKDVTEKLNKIKSSGSFIEGILGFGGKLLEDEIENGIQSKVLKVLSKVLSNVGNDE